MWDLKKKIIFPFGNVYAFKLSANSLVNCLASVLKNLATPSPPAPPPHVQTPNSHLLMTINPSSQCSWEKGRVGRCHGPSFSRQHVQKLKQTAVIALRSGSVLTVCRPRDAWRLFDLRWRGDSSAPHSLLTSQPRRERATLLTRAHRAQTHVHTHCECWNETKHDELRSLTRPRPRSTSVLFWDGLEKKKETVHAKITSVPENLLD